MISIKNLKKSYKVNQEALPIVDIPQLTINKGDRIALSGRSGSGKSTLLHIIGGILSPDEGTVMINDVELTAKKEKERDLYRANHIGYIFQDFHLIPSLSAEENIRIVLRKKGKETEERLKSWFNKVGLYDRRKHLPNELSRGQQQRVAIIRALINNPSIVLADEPTGSLDFETAEQIMELLLELSVENNQTLLCVTHDRHLMQRFPQSMEMEQWNNVISQGKVSV
ncbi:ABC transporter ATP-binding protein [Gracilibacillus sp. S3-1-1]|uniref:ABC transporter ATP-binding protein n=1 Tax=Gracilibacillus pellucidus TaxID=3095368 RepID=A0ACC6M342_9BACI|nr:ABC transporter ATP-binding protein [Gracilibacillus sp. S3-1-1]MDX8045349.1 ABC transporter ATP-binding protein [Gracilibacillus sp. S3-1-1]